MGGGRSKWVRGQCLGRGSTAAVFLAASNTSGHRQSYFAVKSTELSRAAPVQREQKVLSSLCSPYVVSCLGSDVTAEPDGRVLFNLFMEYVPGGSLADAIKQHGGLDEHTIKVYTRGILHGLAYLHNRGIVHCDVKGHNILVGEDGESVKLADFGCARWADDGCDDRGVISGTPLYMAPEVARGEEQGPAADIWALGCTLIEMATGCSPWREATDPVAAIHRIAFSADVPELPCNVSDDARDFLGRCLSRDPRKRWSAEELLDHPFVNCGEEFTDHSKRNSPKSTLDQLFWDSWQDEDDGEDEGEAETARHLVDQPLQHAQERLQRLVDGGFSPSPTANKRWDESCWITIRNGVASEDQKPSTRASYSVEDAIGAIAGDEGLACCGERDSEASVAVSSSSSSSLDASRCSCMVLSPCGGDDVVTVEDIQNSLHYYVTNKQEQWRKVYDYGSCDGALLLHEIELGRLVPICAAMSFRPWNFTLILGASSSHIARICFRSIVFFFFD